MTERDIMNFGRLSIIRKPRRKVFVFGPEAAKNYQLVRTKLNRCTYWFDDVVVMVRSCEYIRTWDGKVIGMGALAQRWADEKYNYYLTHIAHPFPEVYGKALSLEKRDELLLLDLSREDKGVAVAFDDGEDETVKYLIALCKWHKVPTKVFQYQE